MRSRGTAIAKVGVYGNFLIFEKNSMSKVLALYHIVFGTAGRCPVLKGINRLELHRVITSIAAENQSKVMIVNSVDDHLHLLLDLSPRISLSAFMAALKAKSSAWLRHSSGSTSFSSWCKGYYACTVSPSMVRKTINYIESQPEHHKRLDFNAEIRAICEELGFSYHPDDLN